MAPPPDQCSGSGARATPEAAAAMLRRQMSACACACPREEPAARHDRRLSASTTSFSSPAASPTLSASSSSTNYLPASTKLSSESIPEFGKLSSISSTSSYESFFHIEASDLLGADFLDFEPATTRAPAVQTMMAQQQQRPEGAAAAYDPKRLPSSMFRTRSTASPADWSVTSNESLFSIQLSHNSGDLGAMYADLYYDATGFPSFPTGRDAPLKLPSLSESSVRSGGLCVRHDCARCMGAAAGKTRKSVRFATTESVSTEGKHSVVTLEVAMEQEKAPASETKQAPAAGWCELGCCLPSAAPAWWPRCCLCGGCGCQCKWWL
ncbi:hypothetical protein PVAP13_3KG195900 [Panicum virgatum]|uniref:Uncharacterized protein n=1 Tax=Panicum virgatum TaxID=38727 RepID=A0A8T0UW08_PANVG|nr:hypothetical protein PVAP13_3KG195900 [Panicum virgatum]